MSELKPAEKLSFLNNKRALIAESVGSLIKSTRELGIEPSDAEQILSQFDEKLAYSVNLDADKLYCSCMKDMMGGDAAVYFYKEHYLNDFPELETDPSKFSFDAFESHVRSEWESKIKSFHKYAAARDIRSFLQIQEDLEPKSKKGMVQVVVERDWSRYGCGTSFSNDSVDVFLHLSRNFMVLSEHADCKLTQSFSIAIQEVAQHYGGRQVISRSGFEESFGELTMYKSGKLEFLMHEQIANHLSDFLVEFDGFKTFF